MFTLPNKDKVKKSHLIMKKIWSKDLVSRESSFYMT